MNLTHKDDEGENFQMGATRAALKNTGLSSAWGLIFVAVLAACGSDSLNGLTVAVNLSLIVDGRHAHHHSVTSRLFAWIER